MTRARETTIHEARFTRPVVSRKGEGKMMLGNVSTAAPTQYERSWAALAHLTALLTLAVAVSTGGLAHILGLLVPLAIYVYFSNRSRDLAYHALQGTVFQALGRILHVRAAVVAGG